MPETVISGIAAILQRKKEAAERAEERNRPKADYFSSIFPKKTGNQVLVRFLQEIDEGATNYNAERGVGLVVVEHEPPGDKGYMRRGLCSMGTEERCFACEQRREGVEGWRKKDSLYINVAAETSDGVKTFVLSRNANSSFTDALIQEAIDEGTITDKMYRITKTGEGTGTNWLLKAVPRAELLDPENELPVFDIKETVLRTIDYDRQREYYGGGAPKPSAVLPATVATSTSDEW